MIRWLGAMLVVLCATATTGASAAPPDDGTTATTSTLVAANEFLPEDRDLSECVGLVERPDCGSDAKGGWRQGLVLGAIVTGVAFIAWRIFRGVAR